MNPDPRCPHANWQHIFAPMNLAAYLTWLAVVGGPIWRVASGAQTLKLSTTLGFIGAFAVLALFVARASVAHQPQHRSRERVLVLLQAPAALIAFWGLRDGAQAVLLVIVAAQLAVFYPPRVTALLVLAMDVPLSLLLLSRWDLSDAILGLLSYVGFQAFAAMSTRYMRSAEDARDDAMRINAELLATRRLLLESTRGEERLRLSRDLHDVVGHKLTALKLQLRLAERAAEPPQHAVLQQCARLADELLADVRGVVSALREHDGIDLQQALAALVPAVPYPQVRLQLAPDVRVDGVERAEALLRCAQEGLTNALRHSGAAVITLRLAAEAGGVALSVEDNGAVSALPRWGNGLRGMQERLVAVGGQLDLAVATGGGLRLRAWLPRLSETVAG
jgi:signal transduction histidine kinase